MLVKKEYEVRVQSGRIAEVDLSFEDSSFGEGYAWDDCLNLELVKQAMLYGTSKGELYSTDNELVGEWYFEGTDDDMDHVDEDLSFRNSGW